VNILVTGATGFIGSRVVDVVNSYELFTAIAAVRNKNNHLDNNIESVVVDSLGPNNSWQKALNNIDVVIHTAARVHIMSDTAKDPLMEYRKVNVDGTLNLARQAALADVKRFIFLSSIKVNGEETDLEHPFTEDETPLPVDPYGISKYETELGLYELAKKTGMEVVCIRPPLVYGPGVKANFLSMMRWLNHGVPLPFGAVYNKRSLVALDNLVDLIVTCIDHPSAANQTFLVSDDEDLSTSDLLRRVAVALRKKSYMLPINQNILELSLSLLGKRNLVQRLCGSLQVDVSKAKKVLNWTPPVSVDEGLRITAQHFIETRN